MTRGSMAVVLTGPGRMELRRFPLPPIGEEDGLLKVELVGVCGSHPGIFSGRSTRGERPYPIILGHEIVGRIVEIGEKAQRRLGVEVGDRVVRSLPICLVDIAITCTSSRGQWSTRQGRRYPLKWESSYALSWEMR